MLSLNHNKLRNFFLQPASIYAKPILRRIVYGLAFFFVFIILLSTDFVSDKVSFQVGQVSDRDVVAPRTVSYVDAVKTKKLEEEVLNSIANVYDLDSSAMADAEESVAAIFSIARSVITDPVLLSREERINKLMQQLPINLPNTVLAGIIQLNEAELTSAQEQTKHLLQKYFQHGMRDDDIDLARKHIVIETEELGLGKNQESVVAGIAQQLLKPNFILNVRETDKRKQAALASIEPVRETIKKGQILVRSGDVITTDQIDAMEELGLYRGQTGEIKILGLSIFVLLVMLLVLGYLYKFSYKVYNSDLQLSLIGLIILLAILLGRAAHYYSDFVAPIAVGALLASILIDSRTGLLVGITSTILFSVIVDHDLQAVSVALIGSMVGVYSVSKMTPGYSLTQTGIWIALVNFLVIIATGFMQQIDVIQVLLQGVMGVLGGVLSAVITIGLLPYLEHSFNITTTIKLLDLAKPNHPLLQRLLLDAPGTYHHSVLVGNLAETAAGSIGVDPVIVRVGAYYHDIGKIKRPYFFVENQAANDNPHEKIAPSLSTLVVTSHIKDGIDLCREYKIPQIIIDIVQQHHGTTLVSYFYHRAAENEHGECIIEADFRYEGPCPQTKEAAIIMLADACEAAVRSIGKPNSNRIEAMVRKIIRERLHDGQLDDCNLTLKDLSRIGDIFIRVLSSMFHTRIEYPDNVKEIEKRKAKNGNNNKQFAEKNDSDLANGENCQNGIGKNSRTAQNTTTDGSKCGFGR
ncbi:putative membrane protein [Propionispora sp. 2/2-37]|uniref:HD family phosphohydrolase n=1 Tax=Propionispora sp. 2/2-37 TaxID=1677858 RepID=UPI0006BF8DF5|nr:HDIG domain-containing metalloprotein [Propionispora sp. 2/2-37]CUH94160.1 putative membrane protein [Propionispora sp. 2/2-37]